MPTEITNLVAYVKGNTVTLVWGNLPDTARNLVFRDGSMIDDTETGIVTYEIRMCLLVHIVTKLYPLEIRPHCPFRLAPSPPLGLRE